MRFIHMADIHFGAMPDKGKSWSVERSKEIEMTFYRMLTKAGSENIDLLFLAGDIFHRPPLKRELKELSYRLGAIAPVEVVMMAGNHDYIGEASNYRDFVWPDNVHFFKNEKIDRFYIESIDTWVYGLSYEHREIKEALYQGIHPGNEPGFHVLLAHGGDEKHIPIHQRELMNSGFDYVALGHIHKPEIIASNMAYAGSMEPIDRLDMGARGCIYGEIDQKGTRIRFCPVSCREYRELILESDEDMTGAEMEEWLEQQIQIEGSRHMYNVVLKGYRDPDIVYDEERLMQQGRVVSIKDETIPWFDFEKIYNENANNLIGLFIKKVYHIPMDETRRERILSYGLQAMYHGRGENGRCG